MKKSLLGKVIQIFKENPQLTVIKPNSEDPLYSKLQDLPDTVVKSLMKGTSKKGSRMNFQLKSRILMESENPIVSRCYACGVTLT